VKSERTWADLHRAMKVSKPYTAPYLRGCRNCANGRNLMRRDGDDPGYVCRFDEQAGQLGLLGLPAAPERQGSYCCERWEQAAEPSAND
jgi:hypothetical protein